MVNKNELNRLKFENYVWIVFASLCILNIFGDYCEIEYLETNCSIYKSKSNKIFIGTLISTLCIYIYFFQRNYKAYQKSNIYDKNLYKIKLLGSSLLIAGILCLIYFQTNQKSFNESPAL